MEEMQNRFMLSLVAYAVQKNVDAAQLCKALGIDLKDLQGKNKKTLTPVQADNLWINAAHLSGDSLFGLHFGESLQLAALGVVGQLIQSSSTVGEALQQAASFAHLINNKVLIEVIPSETEFTIAFIPADNIAQQNKNVLQQIIDLFMVFTLHELDGLLLTKLQPLTVTLPYLPEALSEYQRVFRCSSIKKGKDFSFSFPRLYWSQQIITADYEMQEFLLKKVSTLQKKAASASGLQLKIYNYILTNAYLGIPALEDMAANLNISARTMQRKLQEEGTTYQVIADAVRKSLSFYYLQSGNYAVKEIAYILGYNELSAFTRAFKRWTGTSPAYYKKYSKQQHLSNQ